VCRALLVVYPKEFRREYGDQMEQVVEDLRGEESGRGVAGIFGLWMRTVPDLLMTSLAERNSDKEVAVATTSSPGLASPFSWPPVLRLRVALEVRVGDRAFVRTFREYPIYATGA
jgi:hypothetical protein